jgi:hypothetical protein
MRKYLPTLLGLLLFWPSEANAVITVANGTVGADITSSGASTTIPSTTLNNTLVVFLGFRTAAADTGTSITGVGGTCTRQARSTNATGARANEIWVCVGISAGNTSVVVNYTTTGDTVSVTAIEYHSTLGIMFIDAGAGSTNLSCTTPTCTGTAITTAGSNDLLLSYFTSNNTTPSAVSAPFSISGGVCTTAQDNHSNLIACSLGSAAATYTPSWTEGTDATANNGTVGISDASIAGGGGGAGMGGKAGGGGRMGMGD